jgi:hypothetical protein
VDGGGLSSPGLDLTLDLADRGRTIVGRGDGDTKDGSMRHVVRQGEAGFLGNYPTLRPVTRTFVIAEGNPTALIWDCPKPVRLPLAKQCLDQNEVEQVGFVEDEQGTSNLVMMGEELCVDAILALAAAQSSTQGVVFAHQVDGPITYVRHGRLTSIKLALPFERVNNTVLFGGIGYLVVAAATREDTQVPKELAIELAQTHRLPAFGIIHYDENRQIDINVYVSDTDSFVQESGSGSGTIATSIVTGWGQITQPTGQPISVQRNGDQMTVVADVRQSA